MTAIPAAEARAGNLTGILAMVAGMACFVVNDAFTKLAGAILPLSEVIVVRGVMAAVLGFGLAYAMGALRPPREMWRPAVALRIIGEVGATLLFLVGLMHMNFAETNAILQFAPLLVTAGSSIILKEQVGWRRWTAAFVGLIGVLMIVQPAGSAFNSYSVLVVLSVLFVALRDLATRRIPAAIPAMMLTLSSALSVMTAGVGLSLFETWISPSPYTLTLLAGAAVFLVGGYYFITIAIRSGEIAVIAPFRYSIVIFAIITGYFVWGNLPNRLALLGILVVAAAGLYTLHRERVRMIAERASVSSHN